MLASKDLLNVKYIYFLLFEQKCVCNERNNCIKGVSYTEEVAALDHTESEAVVENNVAPDCVNDGYYESVVYCGRCDAELSRVGTVVLVIF